MSDLRKNDKTILVALDTLLDTRLGTLLKINPDFAFNVTSKDDYYSREEDKFEDEKYGLLSKELFNKINKQFQSEVIKNSLKTNIYPFLFELCNNLVIRSIGTPHVNNPNITINIDPYELTNLEVASIVKAVHLLLNKEFNVDVVKLSNEELTCEVIKSNYSAMVMYNYGDWMNLHNRKIQTKILKEIILYVPRLNFMRGLNYDEKKLFNENSTDPFKFMSMLVCEFISLQFLPISVFSANTPMNKIEPKRPA